MSGLAQLSYVTAVCSPGRWGAMGSSQFSHIIQEYTGHICRRVYTYLMFLKFHNWKWVSLNLTVSGEGLLSCKIWRYFKFSNLEVSKLGWSHFKNGFLNIFATAECLPSCCGFRDEWVIVWGSSWRLSWGPSIHRGSWNIRSWLTRLWSYSLASLRWLCHSYSSGPPGCTAGSLKKRLAKWF